MSQPEGYKSNLEAFIGAVTECINAGLTARSDSVSGRNETELRKRGWGSCPQSDEEEEREREDRSQLQRTRAQRLRSKPARLLPRHQNRNAQELNLRVSREGSCSESGNEQNVPERGSKLVTSARLAMVRISPYPQDRGRTGL